MTSGSSNISLAEFGQTLVFALAVPVLAQGYLDLVKKLRNNPELAKLATEKGVDAILSGDSAEIAGLRKHNKELVTIAEKEAEKTMTDAVKAHFPEHAIIGEELGFQPGNQIRWVFDPVDGTSAMIRTALMEAFGLPISEPVPAFGITVAMVDGDEAVLGIVTQLQPQHNTLFASNAWVGEKGKLTLHNGSAVKLSPLPATLAECGLASTVPQVMFNTPEKWSGYQALMEATGSTIPDQNCIGFMQLLGKSNTHIVYEADLAYHDAAALVPILKGAGITVSDSTGQDLRFPESAIKKEFSVLAAQPALHTQALDCIRKGVPPERNTYINRNKADRGYANKFPVNG